MYFEIHQEKLYRKVELVIDNISTRMDIYGVHKCN